MAKDKTLFPKVLSDEDTKFVENYQPTDYPPNAVTADVTFDYSFRKARCLISRASKPSAKRFVGPARRTPSP